MDDRSSDGTWTVLESWRPSPRLDGRGVEVTLQRHELNRGKGAGLRTDEFEGIAYDRNGNASGAMGIDALAQAPRFRLDQGDD